MSFYQLYGRRLFLGRTRASFRRAKSLYQKISRAENSCDFLYDSTKETLKLIFNKYFEILPHYNDLMLNKLISTIIRHQILEIFFRKQKKIIVVSPHTYTAK